MKRSIKRNHNYFDSFHTLTELPRLDNKKTFDYLLCENDTLTTQTSSSSSSSSSLSDNRSHKKLKVEIKKSEVSDDELDVYYEPPSRSILDKIITIGNSIFWYNNLKKKYSYEQLYKYMTYILFSF